MAWRSRFPVIGRGILAGLCLAASVPPWGWWPLAFVGIALWDRLLAERSWRSRFLRSWLVAALWLFPSLLWMWDLTAPGYVIAAVVFAAYFGVAGAITPPHGIARWIALPGAIVLAEIARWTFPFGGVPLATLAMGQATAPLGQTARLGTAIFVSGLVVVGGIVLSAAWERRWKAVAVGGAVLVVVTGVAYVAPRGHDVGPLSYALVQGGGPQGTRAVDTDPRDVFKRHLDASQQVQTPVDLVLWPENVVSVEGPLDKNPENEQLSELAAQLDTTLIVGATEGLDSKGFLNAAIVYNPDGTRGERYDKVRRVPFGEYVPLRGFLESIVGQGAGLPFRDAIEGNQPAVVHTPAGTFAVMISWEVFFTNRARDGVVHGGEVLLNPTNGSSYWLTEIQTQQVASSELRSIETGRWTLQAAPTGFSAVIDPDGKLLERSAVSEQRIFEGTVQKREGYTLATVIGPLPTVFLALVLVVIGWLLDRRRRRPPVTTVTNSGAA